MVWLFRFFLFNATGCSTQFSRYRAIRRTDRRQGLWRLPLHKCAEYGSAECFQVLLRAGADPLMEDVSHGPSEAETRDMAGAYLVAGGGGDTPVSVPISEASQPTLCIRGAAEGSS